MAEREIHFSDQEKIDIASAAREVARLGEEVVWEEIRLKYKLAKFAIQAITTGPIKFVLDDNEIVLNSQEIMHEVDVMDEVIRQAGTILQFEGRDTMSELDRAAQKAGWGSVFDPDSKISKSMGRFRD